MNFLRDLDSLETSIKFIKERLEQFDLARKDIGSAVIALDEVLEITKNNLLSLLKDNRKKK